MKALLDAAWRAAAYCVHPWVILWSLLPLALLAGMAFGLGYFYWVPAMDAVRDAFESWDILNALFQWLESIGAGGLKTVLAPMVVIFLATPVLVVASLLVVAWLMAPAMLEFVANRRFSLLERRSGGSFGGSLFVGLSSTLVALAALIVSIPFWLIPMVVLLVPPLIWGWLAYRVMSYDMLAEHASKAERRELIRRHRLSLLMIGIATGYLGAAPSVIWVWAAFLLPLAPLLIPLAMWIYTLVFAFSALWFGHFLLSALQALRREQEAASAALALPPQPPASPLPIESERP